MPTTRLDLFLNGDPLSQSETKQRGFKVQEKDKPFNIWSFENRDKWFVPEDRMDEFRTLYCADLKNSVPRYLTEKNTPIGQLRVDLDIKFDGVVEEHKHTAEQVTAFMKSYMAEAKQYLEIKEPVEIFVLEKDYPTYDHMKKVSSSGIHVQIPALKSRSGVEMSIRRTMVANNGAKMEEAFPALGFNKTWDDVYDKQPLTHTNNWTLLGSKKKDGLPYEIKYILTWDPTTEEMTKQEYTPTLITPDLMKKLSIRTTDPAEETIMTDKGKANTQVAAAPEREVVQISGGRALAPGRGRQAVREPNSSRGSSPGRIYVAPLTETQLQYYEAHVKNLAPFRYTSYKEWVDVGICLKNIHPDLLEVWLDFSAQAGDGYKQSECISKWNGFAFRTDGLTLKSLRYWSKADNLKGFEDAEKKNVDSLIEASAGTGAENCRRC